MVIETSNILAQNQANRDFGRVARKADSHGYAVIMKYNEPKYLVIRMDKVDEALGKLGFSVSRNSG